jgi:hypothetical protein
MMTVASAVLFFTLSAAPYYVDPRVKEISEQEKIQEKKFIDKKTGRRDEKAMCTTACGQVTGLCLSNCRGQKACKDNCTNTIEKSCMKGCATKKTK